MKLKEVISFVKENRVPVFSALLFVTASHFCSLVFPLDPEQNKGWWWLRAAFYSFQNYLGYWMAMRYADKVYVPAGAFFCTMAGIAFTDTIDKLAGEYGYTWLDGPFILITIIYTIKKYAKDSLVRPTQQG